MYFNETTFAFRNIMWSCCTQCGKNVCLCGNKNEHYTLVNENEGMKVWLGLDGNGCGHVLYKKWFTLCNVSVHENVAEEMFSAQAAFPSQYK